MEYSVEHTFTPWPGKNECKVPLQMPLPGAIIFVHGVNSDGEWYDAAEHGLCQGLRVRLARQDGQMDFHDVAAGQLVPVTYTPELTADGFLRPGRTDKSFVDAAMPHHSPVIRFRWGYKASKRELRMFGRHVWLNEHDYWGGGPFANGCTALADLWADGLDDGLFLWLTAQHLNPVSTRDVYACPPRAYCVHAALRLARLMQSIRTAQADCPITIVCHSQGAMVGLAAAFLAERIGVQADNFVLCNPPLSLVPRNLAETFSQRWMLDAHWRNGRQDQYARETTLKNFLAFVRQRIGTDQPAAAVDALMANRRACGLSKGFSATVDRMNHGLHGSTHGRVTLYCNPHDQVIGAASVQGIGWLGVSHDQIRRIGGEGVLTQRVFAQGYIVGQAPGRSYHYWNDRWNKDGGFWHPPSPRIRYSVTQGLESVSGIGAKIDTVAMMPLMWTVTRLLANTDLGRVHAEPERERDGGWQIPIDAPALPEPFQPNAYRHGRLGSFDEGLDPAGRERNAAKPRWATNRTDPYDTHGSVKTDDGGDDAPCGDESSEAQMRYADRGRLRMKARRTGRAAADGRVAGEEPGSATTPDYRQWRDKTIGQFLDGGVNQNATDHSTIVTNPMHAEKALAYDVAIGVCTLSARQWHDLRVEADWRYAGVLIGDGRPGERLSEYFATGQMSGLPLQTWVKSGDARRPKGIIDQRSTFVNDEPRGKPWPWPLGRSDDS